jgi:hypothetical protein
MAMKEYAESYRKDSGHMIRTTMKTKDKSGCNINNNNKNNNSNIM